MTKAETAVFERLKLMQQANPRLEIVMGERVPERTIMEKLHHVPTWWHRLEWQPAIPESITMLPNGTYAYVFDAGEPLKCDVLRAMPKTPKQRAKELLSAITDDHGRLRGSAEWQIADYLTGLLAGQKAYARRKRKAKRVA